MNNAETVAAWRILAQRQNNIGGVRNIPPPVPVSPDKNPIPTPTPTAVGTEGDVTFGGSMIPIAKKRKIR
jgi:hypothetical protein